MNIVEIREVEDIEKSWIVMNQLRKNITQEKYVGLVKEAMEIENYKLFATKEDEEIRGLIGIQPMLTLYYGRYIWICDLIVKEEYRYHGYGEMLMKYVENYANSNNYEKIALSSGITRIDAHKFYENKINMTKVSYVFKKDI